MNIEEIRRKLILALDFSYVQEAIGMIHKVRPTVMHYKVGLELWASTGGDLFHYFNEEELDFFVDLKLHDIPNTASKAVTKIMAHQPSLMTIHASGGAEMMRAAVEAKNSHEHAATSKIVAVTVLTHQTDQSLPQLGIDVTAADQVKRLADEVLFLHRGQMLEKTPVEQFFSGSKNNEVNLFVKGNLLW